jgi:ubiquinone/menaquinone biosynthesis C-methylase UbiE
MTGGDVAARVTAYWDARAPAFDAAASHVANFDQWRRVLEAAFAADGPKDVVDLGTGTGACALVAATLGHRVRGYDASARMLERARNAARARLLAVEFVEAPIDALPAADDSADIVTIRNVLWTLERPADALRQAHRILRPGGRVVVADGSWSTAPQFRSTYAPDLAEKLPAHGGLDESAIRALLAETGFADARAWQHLFEEPPYPGGVPAVVVSAAG